MTSAPWATAALFPRRVTVHTATRSGSTLSTQNSTCSREPRRQARGTRSRDTSWPAPSSSVATSAEEPYRRQAHPRSAPSARPRGQRFRRFGLALALRGERARVPDSPPDPGFELALGLHAFGVDSQPALHRAPTHLEGPRVLLGQELIGVVGIDADQQAPLAAGRDRHVAGGQEGEPPEHPLLGEILLVANQLPDAGGEILVASHHRIMPHRPRRRRDLEGPRRVTIARPVRATLGGH